MAAGNQYSGISYKSFLDTRLDLGAIDKEQLRKEAATQLTRTGTILTRKINESTGELEGFTDEAIGIIEEEVGHVYDNLRTAFKQRIAVLSSYQKDVAGHLSKSTKLEDGTRRFQITGNNTEEIMQGARTRLSRDLDYSGMYDTALSNYPSALEALTLEQNDVAYRSRRGRWDKRELQGFMKRALEGTGISVQELEDGMYEVSIPVGEKVRGKGRNSSVDAWYAFNRFANENELAAREEREIKASALRNAGIDSDFFEKQDVHVQAELLRQATKAHVSRQIAENPDFLRNIGIAEASKAAAAQEATTLLLQENPNAVLGAGQFNRLNPEGKALYNAYKQIRTTEAMLQNPGYVGREQLERMRQADIRRAATEQAALDSSDSSISARKFLERHPEVDGGKARGAMIERRKNAQAADESVLVDWAAKNRSRAFKRKTSRSRMADKILRTRGIKTGAGRVFGAASAAGMVAKAVYDAAKMLYGALINILNRMTEITGAAYKGVMTEAALNISPADRGWMDTVNNAYGIDFMSGAKGLATGAMNWLAGESGARRAITELAPLLGADTTWLTDYTTGGLKDTSAVLFNVIGKALEKTLSGVDSTHPDGGMSTGAAAISNAAQLNAGGFTGLGNVLTQVYKLTDLMPDNSRREAVRMLGEGNYRKAIESIVASGAGGAGITSAIGMDPGRQDALARIHGELQTTSEFFTQAVRRAGEDLTLTFGNTLNGVKRNLDSFMTKLRDLLPGVDTGGVAAATNLSIRESNRAKQADLEALKVDAERALNDVLAVELPGMTVEDIKNLSTRGSNNTRFKRVMDALGGDMVKYEAFTGASMLLNVIDESEKGIRAYKEQEAVANTRGGVPKSVVGYASDDLFTKAVTAYNDRMDDYQAVFETAKLLEWQTKLSEAENEWNLKYPGENYRYFLNDSYRFGTKGDLAERVDTAAKNVSVFSWKGSDKFSWVDEEGNRVTDALSLQNILYGSAQNVQEIMKGVVENLIVGGVLPENIAGNARVDFQFGTVQDRTLHFVLDGQVLRDRNGRPITWSIPEPRNEDAARGVNSNSIYTSRETQ